MPRIQGMPYAEPCLSLPQLRAYTTRMYVSNSDSPPAITKGSFTVPGSTGQSKAAASASATLQGYVLGIYDLQGNAIPGQYVGASPGYDYLIDIIPVGGVKWIIQEDADTTPVPNSSAAFYFDLIIGTINRQSPPQLAEPSAFANVKADSSSANASASGLLCQFQGLAQNNTAAYSATSLASPRLWNMIVIAADADLSI